MGGLRELFKNTEGREPELSEFAKFFAELTSEDEFKKQSGIRLAEEIRPLKEKTDAGSLSDSDQDILFDKIAELERLHSTERPEVNFPEKAEEMIREYLDRVMSEKPESMKEQVSQIIATIHAVAGIDEDYAWEIRKAALRVTNGLDQEDIIGVLGNLSASLMGIDSKQAINFRDELRSQERLIQQTDSRWILHGDFLADNIAGIDADWAWHIRTNMYFNNGYRQSTLKSVAGLDSAAAWDYRDRTFEERPDETIESLAGIDSERAWQMRKRYVEDVKTGRNPRTVARTTGFRELGKSIAGIDSERAWETRKLIIQESPTLGEFALMDSLAGIDSERAWHLRSAFYRKYSENDAAMDDMAKSIIGLNSKRAWDMREKIAKNPELERYLSTSLYGTRWTIPLVKRLLKK